MKLHPRRIRRFVHRHVHWLQSLRSLQPENVYATHVPVLLGIGNALSIRRVAEFGSGLYTTSTFLDRNAFPHLHRLDSFENDSLWLSQVSTWFGSDSRARLHFVTGEMESSIRDIDFTSYDLVFVDDSKRPADRAATITALAKRVDSNNLVLIHDFEVFDYEEASIGLRSILPHRFVFRALLPHTAAFWSGSIVSRGLLRALDGVIGHHGDYVLPDDRETWMRLFETTQSGSTLNSTRQKQEHGTYVDEHHSV